MLKQSEFIDMYIRWLKEKMSFANIGSCVEITTPFLDSHNDHIQIYVQQSDGKLILTDDGNTISELKMTGCDLSSERRKSILMSIINGLGVKLSDSELYVEATELNFPQKKHLLIQAIISVGDMFMLARSHVASIFLEDVKTFLDSNDVRCTPLPQFTGKSGLLHTFEFVIPASRNMPERLVRAINTPGREKVESILFSWNDIRETRQNNSSMYVFLNDSDKAIKNEIPSAFIQYGVKPVIWSERNNVVGELVA